MENEKVELPKIAPSEYADSSRVIHKGPCIVRSVHVSNASLDGLCLVFDGVNEKGKLKASMAILAKTSYTWRPGDGTDFDFGIYIRVYETGTSVTVTYIPESRKAFI